MQVRVDGDGVLTAATHLVARSDLLLGHVGSCERVPDGLSDPGLREALTGLADVAADVLELVAQDLALLATKVRSGVVLYDRVERSVGRGMSR